MNFNTNEFASAIGISSLKRLDKSTKKRVSLAIKIAQEVEKIDFLTTTKFNENDCPFIIPLFANKKYHKIIKDVFEIYNIDFSMTYDQCASFWPWLKPYLEIENNTSNAKIFAKEHILLYIHEGYNNFYFICLKTAFKLIKKRSMQLN